MKLSIVMPAYNEQSELEKTFSELIRELDNNKIDYEFILVDDNSNDKTYEIVDNLAREYNAIKAIHCKSKPGFGQALKAGFDQVSGDAVVIVMADSSDDPKDVVKYFHKLEEGYDCVFGSRFIKGSKVYDYPLYKLTANRLGNIFIQILFLISNNDITNAFKAYRVEVIKAVFPLKCDRFNITVEIPLKAIVKGFKWITVPINWHGRKSGVSKLKLTENMKGYLTTVIKIWFDNLLKTNS